jgi:pectinesterase
VRETKLFSLDAGHNLTRLETVYECAPAVDSLEFAAGLVKRNGVTLATGENEPWIAMWGRIGPKGSGGLGTGVVMPPNGLTRVVDHHGHYLAVGETAPGTPVVHWAGAGWSRSGDFADAAAWNDYLSEWSQRVANPLVVTVLP